MLFDRRGELDCKGELNFVQRLGVSQKGEWTKVFGGHKNVHKGGRVCGKRTCQGRFKMEFGQVVGEKEGGF